MLKGELVGVEVVRVSRVRDADGALCLECGVRFDATTSPYWPWRKSQLLHEQETGHRTALYALGGGGGDCAALLDHS